MHLSKNMCKLLLLVSDSGLLLDRREDLVGAPHLVLGDLLEACDPARPLSHGQQVAHGGLPLHVLQLQDLHALRDLKELQVLRGRLARFQTNSS